MSRGGRLGRARHRCNSACPKTWPSSLQTKSHRGRDHQDGLRSYHIGTQHPQPRSEQHHPRRLPPRPLAEHLQTTATPFLSQTSQPPRRAPHHSRHTGMCHHVSPEAEVMKTEAQCRLRVGCEVAALKALSATLCTFSEQCSLLESGPRVPEADCFHRPKLKLRQRQRLAGLAVAAVRCRLLLRLAAATYTASFTRQPQRASRSPRLRTRRLEMGGQGR